MARHQNMSKLFLVAYFIFAMFEVFLMSGITYGWSSITDVFKTAGFFGALCSKQPPKVNESHDMGKNHRRNGCLAQEKRLNLVFNVAVSLLCGFKLIIGLFIDRFGPRCAQVIGCLLYVAAGFGLAYTTKDESFVLFIIFILFCVGGGFIAVAKYQVSRIIYKNTKSLVLSMLHGAFDSSAAVLLLFKLLRESGMLLRTISLGYTGICLLLIVLSTVFLTPSQKDLRAIYLSEEENANICDFLQSSDNHNTERPRCKTFESIDSVSFSDKYRYKDRYQAKLMIPSTLKASVFFPLYLLELFFLSVIQLKLWFYIGSLDELLEVIFDDDKKAIDYYTTLFGYCQFCGIIAGPVVGCIFDRRLLRCRRYSPERDMLTESPDKDHYRRMRESILPFIITSLMCLLLCVLSLVKSKHALEISFVLHVAIRGFLYASHAAFIGIAFKSQYFGTLYGLGIFLAGVFGLVEYGLYVLTHVMLYGDPFLVNVGLLTLVFLVNVHPFYLSRYCKKIKKNIGCMNMMW